MTDVAMPKLSDSMEEGTIISWLKSTGDQVEIGDELVEIETDKATMAYTAEAAGVLEVLAPVGTSAQVGEPIARIGTTASAPGRHSPKPSARPNQEFADNGASHGNDQATATTTNTASLPPSSAQDQTEQGKGIKATPLARRAAAAHGVALESVRGAGPLGRITRADVLGHAGVSNEPAQRPPEPPPSRQTETIESAEPAQLGIRAREPSRLQQVVARRMSEAMATIPHFQVQTEVDMGAAVALRRELKALVAETQPVPSINDLIIKAAATALRRRPLANGSYLDRRFELHDAINVGFAVAAEQALVVPTVFHADIKSLGQIAEETRRLAGSVRDGTITPPDVSGGTFTVSNLGMFGMTAITPVINPPQAAILGVGALRAVLARVDQEIVERTIATFTLSCDHRILYGADAARFLSDIRELLETPARLAL
jgi:pyruvate dehydrogenase E2 component (dihydrolipoamide acetyltransferase)